MRGVRRLMAAGRDGCITGPGGEHDGIPDEPDIARRAFPGRFDTSVLRPGPPTPDP